MKKLLIGCLMIIAIGTTAFARMHDGTGPDPKPLPPHLHKMRDENYRRNPELERGRILIDEKRLEIRKELLNENPDWNKIERLNIDIATQEAKNRTFNMRCRYDEQFNKQFNNRQQRLNSNVSSN